MFLLIPSYMTIQSHAIALAGLFWLPSGVIHARHERGSRVLLGESWHGRTWQSLEHRRRSCWCGQRIRSYEFQDPMALLMVRFGSKIFAIVLILHMILGISSTLYSLERTSCTIELRLCFPTMVANTSPLAILPSFVEILGRKLDKISAELDWLLLSFSHVCTFPPHV